MARSTRINLLEGPVGGTLLRLAGPMVLGLIAVIMFNVVDTIYVGRLGKHQLAAMSFTFPVVFLIMSIAMGMGMGVTSAISRAIGGGDHQDVRRLATDGLLLANTLVTVTAIAGLLTITPLFTAMGASGDMVAMIKQYMLPWYIGIGFIVIPMVGNSAIRATGDTKTPSMIMIIAGGLNVALDPLLIFGIGPFPRLELQGAAIATVISYALTFIAALWILSKREQMLDFSRPHMRQVMDSWRRILYVGAPAAATQMLIPLAGGVLTRMVSGFGPEAVAAYGVGTRIDAVSIIGIGALGAATTPFVGQNYGAGNCDRIREAMRFCLRSALVYGVVMAGLLYVLSRPVAELFNDDATVVALIQRYVHLVPISYTMFGSMLLVNSMFNAMNKPMRSALLIVLRLFVLAIPLAWLGGRIYAVPGVFGGISVANMVVGLVAIFMVRGFLTNVERVLARERPPVAQS